MGMCRGAQRLTILMFPRGGVFWKVKATRAPSGSWYPGAFMFWGPQAMQLALHEALVCMEKEDSCRG